MGLLRHRRAFLVLVALLAGCVVIGGNGDWGEAKFKATRTSSAPGAPAIVVRARNGAIVIRRGTDAQTAITATIAAITQERLDATRVIAEIQHDGGLLVTVKWPDDRPADGESCSFEITVPATTAAVAATTSNGAIALAQLSGPAELETSNGAISVTNHAGSVDASTSNGQITLTRVAGAVDARTSNGRIRLDEIAGRIGAHTSNGAVDVTLLSSFSGRFSLSTSNGSINVSTAPPVHDFHGDRNHANIAIGDNTAESEIGTSNGSIDIRIK